jgi:hypothetical protein
VFLSLIQALLSMICPVSSALWGGVEAAQWSPGAGTTGTLPVAEYKEENDTNNKKLKIKRTVLFSFIGSFSFFWLKNGYVEFEATLSRKKLIVSLSRPFNATQKF